MCNDSDEGKTETSRGQFPKPRKAIHDLTNRPVINMNKYITGMINDDTQSSESEEDYDEVDNSKIVRPMSPTPLNRRLTRSLSANIEISKERVDTNSEDILPKSLPLEFYTHSHYRDENDQHNNSRLSNTSGSSIGHDALESSNQQLTNQNSQISEKKGLSLKKFFFISLLGIFCYQLYFYYYNNNIGVKIYDKFNFYDDVRSLAKKYQIKQDSILQVRTGIDTIFKKEDTGSFIFTFDGNVVNPVHFNDFMDNIASASSRYLRNNTKNVKHVVLDNNKIITFKSDEELIHDFRENVHETGVLLVKNIERVPAKLAMAFHYYCDEYNPLIKKSAIFFTLDVAKCKMPLLSKVSLDHDYIERCLKDKWRDIDPERIGPLLTRVVTIIVDVTNI